MNTNREKLLFTNPVFHNGLQVTVRKGDKWNNLVTHLPFQADVAQTGSEAVVVGQATIVGKLFLYMHEIPDSILGLHHNPSCRYFNGLCDAMVRAYGGDWHRDRHEVTILFFYFDEAVPNGNDSITDPEGGDTQA